MSAKNRISSNANAYPSTFAQTAKLSGSALKVITTRQQGIYPVQFHLKTGTSAVMSCLFLIACGMKAVADKLAPEAIVNAFGTLEANWSNKEGSIYKKLVAISEKNTESKYENYKTLKTRILKEVKRGAITGFAPADMETAQKLLATVR